MGVKIAAAAWLLTTALLLMPCGVRADAGPPYLTNDPGTPGDGHLEINLASMQTIERGQASYEVPQIDVNFGLGERIQLSYEIPYVVQTSSGGPRESGWSNASTGVKWRFLDQGGWQVSTFPQLQTAASAAAQRTGIAVEGPRLLLPLEIAKTVGHLTVFQRTPNWCFPLNNSKITPEEMRDIRARYPEILARCRETPSCYVHGPDPRKTLEVTPEDREAFWEKLYRTPGFGQWQGDFSDTLTRPD